MGGFKVVTEGVISIRALLAEGDSTLHPSLHTLCYFNPRPPCGGRHPELRWFVTLTLFQSAPSLRRATAKLNNSTACHMFKIAIFIYFSGYTLSGKLQRYL